MRMSSDNDAGQKITSISTIVCTLLEAHIHPHRNGNGGMNEETSHTFQISNSIANIISFSFLMCADVD